MEDQPPHKAPLVQTQNPAFFAKLTAGIAHEIKNPLNFVNNFSGISAELITELQEALADVSLNEKRRSEVTELMDTLRGNLDKVVQHGNRQEHAPAFARRLGGTSGRRYQCPGRRKPQSRLSRCTS